MKALMAIALAFAASVSAPTAFAQMGNDGQAGGGHDQRSANAGQDHRGTASQQHVKVVEHHTTVTHRTTSSYRMPGMHDRHCHRIYRHHHRVNVCR